MGRTFLISRHYGVIGFYIAVTILLQSAASFAATCDGIISGSNSGPATQEVAAYPRDLNPQQSFDALVKWIHDEIIVKKGAPGLVVGISGTDSIVAFLACAKAFEMAGRPNRVAGIHFAPSDEFIADVPAAAAHLWFQDKVIPWLRGRAPFAHIEVDTSFDFRRDGLRWGALMDWSVVQSAKTMAMRPPEEQYWVVGTRNATEEALFTYSNVSTAASVQVLNHLWKGEVLQISKFLGAPAVAIEKSCEVDCVCGRQRLPALHVPEVDALLMVRQGVLSQRYVEENMPTELRRQLSAYIETQIKGSQFKSQVPYMSAPEVIQVNHFVSDETVAAVKDAMAQDSGDSRLLSRITPLIVTHDLAAMASDLVTAPAPDGGRWIAERLALFNAPSLRSSQKRRMIESIFGPELPSDVGPAEISGLAQSSARLGNYAFSFPQWRFLSQSYAGRSALAEQFGMQSLTRSNDVRDQSLLPSDPNRDEWGKGFVWHDEHWYVEYRRAYIMVAKHDSPDAAVLIIRNSSHYFGRDRLKQAVYLSLNQSRSVEELQNLTVQELEDEGRYVPWQNILRVKPEIATAEKIKRTTQLLEYLDHFNLALDRWFRPAGDNVSTAKAGPQHSLAKKTAGAQALLDFLEHKLIGRSQTDATPLYLGVIQRNSPSWYPRTVVPLTAELLSRFRASLNLNELILNLQQHQQVVLMTGENGDFP